VIGEFDGVARGKPLGKSTRDNMYEGTFCFVSLESITRSSSVRRSVMRGRRSLVWSCDVTNSEWSLTTSCSLSSACI
jgi:hypothetical protein